MWSIVLALGGVAQSDWRSMEQVSHAHRQITRALKIDARSLTRLRKAVKTGDRRTCSALVSNLNVNWTGKFGHTLLYYATLYRHYDIAHLLLSRGAAAGGTFQTLDLNPLYLAAGDGQLVFLGALVKRLPPGLKLDRLVTTKGAMSLLHAAAMGINLGHAGCWDVLQWLIGTKKMDINLTDQWSRTAADVLRVRDNAEPYYAMLARLGLY